jgi:very-short-patch-repair endonuclease
MDRSTAYQGEGNPNWSNALKCVCELCQKEFQAVSHDNKPKSCLECRSLVLKGERNWNWAGRVEVTYLCCGKTLSVTPLEAQRRKFCSIACSNIYRNQTNRKSATDIELAMEDWLTKQNIPFESQVVIPNIGIVDFLIGTTVLECDGEYWHQKPGRAAYDLRRDTKLNKLGYPVIRLNSEEIKAANLSEIIHRKAWIATAHNQWRQSWQQ